VNLADATATLAAAGVSTPRVDAELLLAHVLDVPRSRLLLVQPTPDQLARFAGLVARRAERVPLQHLTGAAPFRHLELAVGPGVFVPRPETELLVDAVLPERPACVVDLCAGSGALALAIATELPGVTVHAVESSADALEYLRRNADGTTGVTVVAADARDDRRLKDLDGTVDVVVSNPPYVPSPTEVAPEVRADPAVAVFAGPDGLEIIPSVIARAADLLRDGGLLVMEHDDTHGSSVPGLMMADPAWTEVCDHPDLSGRPRFVTARRCSRHR
jgi:release factor glutamine methyltransferase